MDKGKAARAVSGVFSILGVFFAAACLMVLVFGTDPEHASDPVVLTVLRIFAVEMVASFGASFLVWLEIVMIQMVK